MSPSTTTEAPPPRPSGELAALVLAAGSGTRLQPLTAHRPKPLCPVGFESLLDHALERVAAALGPDAGLAVNLSHAAARIESHLAAGPWHHRVHRSIEAVALGTAGAVGPLRAWLDGRGLLIVNGDTWCPAALTAFVEAWDGERVAVAVSGPPPLHSRSGIVASILPWREARTVEPVPAGLWERFWRERLAAGALQSVGVDGPFVDCATPADYVRANLTWLEAGPGAALGGAAVHPSAVVLPGATVDRSVVGSGAVVAGSISRTVVWPGARIAADEVLVDCVRTDDGSTVRVGASAPPPG